MASSSSSSPKTGLKIAERFASYPVRTHSFPDQETWLELSEAIIRNFIEKLQKTPDMTLFETLEFLGNERAKIAVTLKHGSTEEETKRYGALRGSRTREVVIADRSDWGDQTETIIGLLNEFINELPVPKTFDERTELTYENECFGCTIQHDMDDNKVPFIYYKINIKRDIQAKENLIWEMYGCDLISIDEPLDEKTVAELKLSSKTVILRSMDKIYYSANPKELSSYKVLLLADNTTRRSKLDFFDFCMHPSKEPRQLSIDEIYRSISIIGSWTADYIQPYSKDLLLINYFVYRDSAKNQVEFVHEKVSREGTKGNILIAEKVWGKLKTWPKDGDPALFLVELGKLVREMIDIAPYSLGSSAILQWLMLGIAHVNKIGLSGFNHEKTKIGWDFKAFCTFTSRKYGLWFAKELFLKIVSIPDERPFSFNLTDSLPSLELKFPLTVTTDVLGSASTRRTLTTPSEEDTETKDPVTSGLTSSSTFFKEAKLVKNESFNTFIESLFSPYYAKRNLESAGSEAGIFLSEYTTINNGTSGRLQNVTPFQYALWMGHKELWEVMLPFMDKKEALRQIEELESKGFTYEVLHSRTGDISETRKESFFNYHEIHKEYRQCLINWKKGLWTDKHCMQWSIEKMVPLRRHIPHFLSAKWEYHPDYISYKWTPTNAESLQKDMSFLFTTACKIERERDALKRELIASVSPKASPS